MKVYVVVDEFGFEIAGPFSDLKSAEESRNFWANKENLFNVEYTIEQREYNEK